jgi:hypothetical protein
LLLLASAYALIVPREGGGTATFVVATAVAGLSVFAALLEATPIVAQGYGEVVALALPANVGVAWALAAARNRAQIGAGSV